MSWIKLSDTVYAKEATPDPQEIVDISVLQSELDEVTKQIDEFKMVEESGDASEEVYEAVRFYNNTVLEERLALLVNRKMILEDNLKEILNG